MTPGPDDETPGPADEPAGDASEGAADGSVGEPDEPTPTSERKRERKPLPPVASSSHRLDLPGAESSATIATVVIIVVVLLVGVGLVLTTGPGGDRAREQAASSTPTAGTTSGGQQQPGGQAGPGGQPTTPEPTLPPDLREIRLRSLSDVDRTMAKKGMTRVPRGLVESVSFVVSSFNILGASHTSGPGRRRGFADAGSRLGAQIQLLDLKNVSVAGLQESQGSQILGLLGRTGDEWGAYPAMQLGPLAADNSIIWRNAEWALLRAETSDIPYFGGRIRQMPHVLLQHRATGRKVWFGNYHNPADVGGNQAGNRARALSIEAALSRELNADGTPVVITGDMNDRAEFACPFSEQSGMVSADGARHEDGRCLTPSKLNVDWIWGTREFAWSGFLTDYQTEHRKLSDHPMITATANIQGVADDPDCTSRITAKGVYWYCKDASTG